MQAPGAAADPELQPTTADQVRGGRLLGHVQRVFVADVDHASSDLDARRPRCDRGEQRKRRGELSCEVVDTDVHAVDAELLRGARELDRLQQGVGGGGRL
jgi:hypothetical protein